MSWLTIAPQIALALLKLANAIYGDLARRGVKLEGYREAVGDQALETLRVVGVSQKARQEVAKWSDEQVDDYLTRP